LLSILQPSFPIRAIDYAKVGARGLGGVGGAATTRTQPTLLSQPGAR
jgi:hypothetical protein